MMAAPIGTPMAMLGRIYGNERQALHRVESGIAICDRGEARFRQPDETQCGAKVFLRQTLVAQHHRQRWSRDRRDGVEHADAAAKNQPHRPFGPYGPSIPCGLKQDQRQQHDERAEPEPAWVDHRNNRGAEDDARQQPDDDRQHAAPDPGQRIAIDPQHVGVEHDFDRHECRVEDAIGEEQQGDRNGDRREAVSEGAVDDRCGERDSGESYLSGIHRVGLSGVSS